MSEGRVVRCWFRRRGGGGGGMRKVDVCFSCKPGGGRRPSYRPTHRRPSLLHLDSCPLSRLCPSLLAEDHTTHAIVTMSATSQLKAASKVTTTPVPSHLLPVVPTKQDAFTTPDGYTTEILTQAFQDRILVLVTQVGKVGCLVSPSLLSPSLS